MSRSAGLEAEQVGDEILLLLFRELELEDDVEELDGVVQCRAAAVVEVWRAVIDAAQREGFDRPLGAAGVEALGALARDERITERW